MKTKLHIALLSAAMLPALALTATAAEGEKPRPAQESKSVTTTGSDATQSSDKAQPRSSDAANLNTATSQRPAQQSRGGTTTGRTAIDSPATTQANDTTVNADTKKKEMNKDDKRSEKKADR